MRPRRPGGFRSYASVVPLAVTLSTLVAGGGCSGGVAPTGPDPRDAGGDVEQPDAGGDVEQPCPGLGCAPQCPAGVLRDSHGCFTCTCAPVPDAGGTGACTTDADCANGGICGFLESAGCTATGQCFPAPTGARCALASAVGCGCAGSDVSIDPSCYSGLPAGYQTKPVLHEGACEDAGAACVSQRGGRCGGNTSHPCTCASGLTCTPGDSGLPFGDVGGSCE
jgi:Antistasin family